MARTPGRRREQPGLREPVHGDGNAAPRVQAVGVWHRCVAARHAQPWWFSSRTDPDPGRFDLEEPDGTCYLAASPVAAVVERLADPEADVPIRPTVSELDRLRVWSGELDEPPPSGGHLDASPALEFVVDLPPDLRPTAVGHHDEFTIAPPPGP